MSVQTIGIGKETLANLRTFSQEYPLWKQHELISYAVNWFIDYFRKYQALPPKEISKLSTNDVSQMIPSDLPGLTAEVIQSHLVRFPKVTPDDYRGIIEELRRRQASEEGLKNPEAAAYGLCKRIQSGHGSHGDIEAKKQNPTPSETAETSVPDDAFAYPPQF